MYESYCTFSIFSKYQRGVRIVLYDSYALLCVFLFAIYIYFVQEMSPKQEPSSSKKVTQEKSKGSKRKAFDFSSVKSVDIGYVLDWNAWTSLEAPWKKSVKSKLTSTGLKNILTGSEPYLYEDIVEFYKHLTLQHNSLFSRVQGSTISINASVLENMFGLKGTVTELPHVPTPAMLEFLRYD